MLQDKELNCRRPPRRQSGKGYKLASRVVHAYVTVSADKDESVAAAHISKYSNMQSCHSGMQSYCHSPTVTDER